MKRVLLLFIATISLNTFGQNVDAIVNNYIKAIGGQEKTDSIKSYIMNTTTIVKGLSKRTTMEIYINIDGSMYVKNFEKGHASISLAFDGKKGYLHLGTKYIDLTEVNKKITQVLTNKKFYEIDYLKSIKDSLTYAGRKKINGVNCEVLILKQNKKKSNEHEIKFYFNPKTHLLVAVEKIIDLPRRSLLAVGYDPTSTLAGRYYTKFSSRTVKDSTTFVEKYISYKEFGGIKFPSKTKVFIGGKFQFTTITNFIKVNPPAPDSSVFIKPKK